MARLHLENPGGSGLLWQGRSQGDRQTGIPSCSIFRRWSRDLAKVPQSWITFRTSDHRPSRSGSKYRPLLSLTRPKDVLAIGEIFHAARIRKSSTLGACSRPKDSHCAASSRWPPGNSHRLRKMRARAMSSRVACRPLYRPPVSADTGHPQERPGSFASGDDLRSHQRCRRTGCSSLHRVVSVSASSTPRRCVAGMFW